MTLTGIGEVPCVHCIPSAGNVTLTVFSEDEAGHSPQPQKCEAGRMDEQFPVRSRSELPYKIDRGEYKLHKT